MAVLLVGPPPGLGVALIERLLGQGDEVRVLERDAATVERWKAAGAHVATGTEWDADLIARAATDARTIVMFAEGSGEEALLSEVLAGARLSAVERLVLVGPRLAPETLARVGSSGLDHVVLLTARRGVLPRRPPGNERVAEAIDAADDMAGRPRLVLDLTREPGWRALRLDPP